MLNPLIVIDFNIFLFLQTECNGRKMVYSLDCDTVTWVHQESLLNRAWELCSSPHCCTYIFLLLCIYLANILKNIPSKVCQCHRTLGEGCQKGIDCLKCLCFEYICCHRHLGRNLTFVSRLSKRKYT